MYTWEIPTRKWVTPQGGLEFRLNTILIGKQYEGRWPRKENKWLLEKMNRTEEEQREDIIICDKVWVWYQLLCQLPAHSPVIRVDLPWLMRPPGRGFMTIEFLWRTWLQADNRSSQKTSFCIAVFQVYTVQNNRYAKVGVKFWGVKFCYPSEDWNIVGKQILLRAR